MEVRRLFKDYFERKRKERFAAMELRVSSLSDDELKEWYVGADTQLVLGHACKYERKLHSVIETELNKRGFEYMEDY